MARISGRHGELYVDLTGAGAATPVPFLSKFSINFTIAKIDVSAFNDGNKVYVAGLPDAAGDFSGFYDTATPQLYTAASDGIARKTYLYIDNSAGSVGTYFFGTATFDWKIEVDNAGAAAVSGTWSAASTWARVG